MPGTLLRRFLRPPPKRNEMFTFVRTAVPVLSRYALIRPLIAPPSVCCRRRCRPFHAPFIRRPMAGRFAITFAALAIAILLTIFSTVCILGVTHTASPVFRSLYHIPRADPHFSTTSSFINHWASAWNDYSVLRDAPLGQMLADLVQALHRHQNPADCASANFLIFEYNTALGFGAQIRHIAAAFYTAVQTDRVFVLSDRVPFYWANGCPREAHNRRFTCHFRALSETCPFSKVRRLIKSGAVRVVDADYSSMHNFARNNIATATPSALRLSQKTLGARFTHFLNSFAFQDDFAAQLKLLLPSVPLHHLQPHAHARRLWLSAAAFYVTRLNEHAAAHVRSGVERALNRSAKPGPSRLIGMPIRGSDKCFGDGAHAGPGEMTCVSLHDAVDAVMRLALMQPELTHVIVTSEDASAVSEHKLNEVFDAFDAFNFGRRLRVVRHEEDCQPGTGNTKLVLSKLGKKQAQLLDSMLIVLHLQALAYVLALFDSKR
eukprot:TRINITY_DN14402_c0_g3_i1.p1 TRINITY_DN14402_c0_g3~~TRINITY_DN14402_c0_g3_i1.p1  ORF type:complete len:490 (+),score=80.37 TRINITY_DN14402_c0_g3_i1:1198-2667(+)